MKRGLKPTFEEDHVRQRFVRFTKQKDATFEFIGNLLEFPGCSHCISIADYGRI